MSQEPPQVLINQACERLQWIAAEMGVRLELSRAYVRPLEDIVTGLAAEKNASALQGGTFMVGCYLGEIIRRAADGEWTGFSPAGSPILEVRDAVFYPVDRVRKFASEPEGEGLEIYADVATASRDAPLSE